MPETTMRQGRPALIVAAIASMLMISGCATSAETPVPGAKPGSSATERKPASFSQWRDQFRARALSAGISPATFDRAFAGVSPNEKVLEQDAYQPEFTRPIWEYLDSAVSENRISTGRSKAEEKRSLIEAIERRYGVDGPIVLAIWGLESGFGAQFGDIPVIESMATLAYEGRRRDFAEEQLIAALKILEAGDITPERMVGSWAGAMGHTQFIPTSFLAHAVDFDGNGRRDVWHAEDALASTANYLGSSGWRQGAPVAVEIRLPEGFDYAERSEEHTSELQSRGHLVCRLLLEKKKN